MFASLEVSRFGILERATLETSLKKVQGRGGNDNSAVMRVGVIGLTTGTRGGGRGVWHW